MIALPPMLRVVEGPTALGDTPSGTTGMQAVEAGLYSLATIGSSPAQLASTVQAAGRARPFEGWEHVSASLYRCCSWVRAQHN
jgi:hypothetical protein